MIAVAATAPFTMPIYFLGSLQYFADVREANNNINKPIPASLPDSEDVGTPAGFSLPVTAGASVVGGEG